MSSIDVSTRPGPLCSGRRPSGRVRRAGHRLRHVRRRLHVREHHGGRSLLLPPARRLLPEQEPEQQPRLTRPGREGEYPTAPVPEQTAIVAWSRMSCLEGLFTPNRSICLYLGKIFTRNLSIFRIDIHKESVLI